MTIRHVCFAVLWIGLWVQPLLASPFDIQQHSEVSQVNQPSVLIFDPKILHLHDVLEGKKVEQQILIRNIGQSSHRIVRIESSCGCTTAEPEMRILEAGGFTSVRIDIDTFGKTGEVKKTLSLLDEQGRKSTLLVYLHVQPNPHLSADKRSIFDGSCAACHFAPAAGKTQGVEIYAAVCVMCHGEQGQGGYAPRLIGYHNQDALNHLIAHGTGSTHMPAFSKKQGGPLTTRQINALSRWIISLDD